MPGPDPHGVYYDETPDGRPLVYAEIWPSSGFFPGNPRHRKARQAAVARNIRHDGWVCAWCREPVPIFRRADAIFCSERCRKRAARWRRGLIG